MTILSKACKPDNFEWHDSLKAFIQILLIVNLSLNQTLLTFLLCVRKTYTTLPLIRKDSRTHMHGLTVYVKEGLPFARGLCLENSADSYLYF